MFEDGNEAVEEDAVLLLKCGNSTQPCLVHFAEKQNRNHRR